MLGGVPFQLPEDAPQDGYIPVREFRPPENPPQGVHDSSGIFRVEEADAPEEVFQMSVHALDLLKFRQLGKGSGSRGSSRLAGQAGHE